MLLRQPPALIPVRLAAHRPNVSECSRSGTVYQNLRPCLRVRRAGRRSQRSFAKAQKVEQTKDSLIFSIKAGMLLKMKVRKKDSCRSENMLRRYRPPSRDCECGAGILPAASGASCLRPGEVRMPAGQRAGRPRHVGAAKFPVLWTRHDGQDALWRSGELHQMTTAFSRRQASKC